ncbi:MAG: hypothetical protein HWD61_09080 [Parachlamydiaceae bacterium]|nr:MAG: hypothetical protein HWD61_09080 [Parachlamydiaceae bacterium]
MVRPSATISSALDVESIPSQQATPTISPRATTQVKPSSPTQQEALQRSPIFPSSPATSGSPSATPGGRVQIPNEINSSTIPQIPPTETPPASAPSSQVIIPSGQPAAQTPGTPMIQGQTPGTAVSPTQPLAPALGAPGAGGNEAQKQS